MRPVVELETVVTETYSIMLFNDDVNSFDWVIQSLRIEINTI
ncbi:MAG: ATP-dependent Clp protease adaptor ClpS [Bacteroidetes bacterium]|nr:ATP-dependent Clp protease adaptor ClpS [Bacteroidota bacterium]